MLQYGRNKEMEILCQSPIHTNAGRTRTTKQKNCFDDAGHLLQLFVSLLLNILYLSHITKLTTVRFDLHFTYVNMKYALEI